MDYLLLSLYRTILLNNTNYYNNLHHPISSASTKDSPPDLYCRKTLLSISSNSSFSDFRDDLSFLQRSHLIRLLYSLVSKLHLHRKMIDDIQITLTFQNHKIIPYRWILIDCLFLNYPNLVRDMLALEKHRKKFPFL